MFTHLPPLENSHEHASGQQYRPSVTRHPGYGPSVSPSPHEWDFSKFETFYHVEWFHVFHLAVYCILSTLAKLPSL